MTARLLTLLTVCLLLSRLANAQPYAASVQHYGLENGLPHRETNTIIQDKQGFIWIATKGGLSRFDGKTFTNYNKEHNGFTFDDTQFIAEDADGMLWLMATQRPWEVMILNPRTGKAQTFAEKFGQALPTVTTSGPVYDAMAGGSDGTVYLTKHRPVTTLLSYHPKTGLRHTSFPQYKSLALCHATRRGTVWAIADNNIMAELHPDGRVLRQYKHSVRYLVMGLGAQNNDGLFFYLEYPGTYPYKAVYSIDEQGNRHQWPNILLGNKTSYEGAPPMPFYLKSLGLVWEGNRLFDQRGAVLLNLSEQGFSDLGGRGVFLDRSGRLWLSNNFGINAVKLAPSRFKRLFYSPVNDPEVNVSTRGIRVIGNNLYVNREAKGLYKADRTGRITQTLFETRDWGGMCGLAQDRQGRLVAGAHREFLQSDTARRTVRFFPLPSNDSQSMWSFYAFSETHLLAGTEQGLRLIDARTGHVELFRQYNQFPELAQAHTLHIGPDRQGTIWLCTTTGLYTFDPRLGITARYWSGGKGQHYLPTDNFQHVYHAPNGLFWLATANQGLVRWDRARGLARTFQRADGLSNDNIYAVYADRRGHLWLSSDYGIMRFDPVR